MPETLNHASHKVVITGYNTDVEHNGVVYHVQTEDKGAGMPLILSLVYVGGAILASKRSPYDDLINAGLDEALLAERLQRQHKLICAAIHAGRIEDLQRLSQSEGAARQAAREELQTPVPSAPTATAETVSPPVIPFVPPEPPETFAPAPPATFLPAPPETFAAAQAGADDDKLRVTLLDDQALRAGEAVTVSVRVTRGSDAWERVVPGARVVFKTLGSTFRPAFTAGVTARDGVASALLTFPAFKSGRAAVLVRVEIDEEVAELRRVILPR